MKRAWNPRDDADARHEDTIDTVRLEAMKRVSWYLKIIMSFWTVIASPRRVHVVCAEVTGNTHCIYNDRTTHARQTHNRLRRSNIVKAEGSMHCCWTIRDCEKVLPWSFPCGSTGSTYDVWLCFWSSSRPPRQRATTNCIAYIFIRKCLWYYSVRRYRRSHAAPRKIFCNIIMRSRSLLFEMVFINTHKSPALKYCNPNK